MNKCFIVSLLAGIRPNPCNTWRVNSFFIVLFLVGLCGCMPNHYEDSYAGKNTSYFAALPAVAPKNQPVVLKVATTEEDVINIIEDGYVPIGSSSFRSAYNGMTCAVDTAEKHGAQLVLLDIQYKETKNYTSILYLPSRTSSFTSGTAYTSTYGAGGGSYGTAYYSGRTTTRTTTAVPVQRSVNLYSHDALFFKKVNPRAFYGIVPFIPKRLPTEKAEDPVPVTILAVMRGSQAEADGFKRGQKIVAINGTPLSNRESVAPFSGSILSIKSVEVAK